VITESGVVSKTASGCTTEKRSDSDSAVEVEVARSASLVDFLYEAHLCLLLHFALMWPFTPHPWNMTWLLQSLPFLSSPCLRLQFSPFKCRPRPVSGINSAASGASCRALQIRPSKATRWVTILATVSAFSVSLNADANVCHSSVFGRWT